jgi:hypothetical protein
MDMLGEIGIGMLVTAVIGIAVITAIAQLTPNLITSVGQASGNLSTLGVGGTIGSLLLTLLVGIAVGLGLAKLAGKIFGVELGV